MGLLLELVVVGLEGSMGLLRVGGSAVIQGISLGWGVWMGRLAREATVVR